MVSLPFELKGTNLLREMSEPIERWPIFMHEFTHLIHTAGTSAGLRYLIMDLRTTLRWFLATIELAKSNNGIVRTPIRRWLREGDALVGPAEAPMILMAERLESKLDFLEGRIDLARLASLPQEVVLQTSGLEMRSVDVSSMYGYVQAARRRSAPVLTIEYPSGPVTIPLSMRCLAEGLAKSIEIAHGCMSGRREETEATVRAEEVQPDLVEYYAVHHVGARLLPGRGFGVEVMALLCELAMMIDGWVIGLTDGSPVDLVERSRDMATRLPDVRNSGWVFWDLVMAISRSPGLTAPKTLEELDAFGVQVCHIAGHPHPARMASDLKRFAEASLPELDALPIHAVAKRDVRERILAVIDWRESRVTGLLVPALLAADFQGVRPEMFVKCIPTVIAKNGAAVSRALQMADSRIWPFLDLFSFHSLVWDIVDTGLADCPIRDMFPASYRERLCEGCKHDYLRVEDVTLRPCSYSWQLGVLLFDKSPITKVERVVLQSTPKEA